ncbi:MAG: class I SAM-dependent methyltransferase [Alteraurantiacibacter sp.]
MPDSTQQTRVTNFFEVHAETYGKFFAAETHTGAAETFRNRLDLVAKALAGGSGRLLDMASGTGEITAAVNACGDYSHVFVNDISVTMLDTARRTLVPRAGQQVVFSNLDGFTLGDNQELAALDVILCLGLIAHVGRLDELFAMFDKLLQPSGRVAMQTTVADQHFVRISRVINERRVAAGNLNPIHFFRVSEITEAARRAGFALEHEERFGVQLPFGDKLLGPGNFVIERMFGRDIGRFGGEAVLVFRKAA